eukprot:3643812-Amphidinium_carterae.2
MLWNTVRKISRLHVEYRSALPWKPRFAHPLELLAQKRHRAVPVTVVIYRFRCGARRQLRIVLLLGLQSSELPSTVLYYNLRPHGGGVGVLSIIQILIEETETSIRALEDSEAQSMDAYSAGKQMLAYASHLRLAQSRCQFPSRQPLHQDQWQNNVRSSASRAPQLYTISNLTGIAEIACWPLKN